MLPCFTRCLWLSTLLGCSPTTYTQGVPNLVQVKSDLWRSGQPSSDDQWRYIASLGVTEVVKLNFASEGSDDGAIRAGLTVHVLSIQPEGDKNLLDNVLGTFIEPDARNVALAEAIIAQGGGVLVHCTHGQDRTGLVIGISRLLFDDWSKARAWDEMLDKGFHADLLGLVAFFLDYDAPKADAGTSGDSGA
jgi:protein tyrosine/serine phosphatase